MDTKTADIDLQTRRDSIAAETTIVADSLESAVITSIEPAHGWQFVNFRELWRYRELLYFLVWRDVKVRYKQTALGASWAVFQPLMTMLVFSMFFGRFGGMSQTVDTPYPLFVFAGLLPWMCFATATNQSALSVVNSSHLITKIYFPRLLIPFAAIGASLLDFLVSCVVLACMMAYYQVTIGWHLLWSSASIAATVLSALGVGTLLAGLVVAYRDIRHTITFLVQIWMFVSPVAYPIDIIPEKWRLIYAINPMVGPLVSFRHAILGGELAMPVVLVSALSAILFLFAGVALFRRVERHFADVI